DLGNTSIFPSLITGGCLHVISYDTATDGNKFARYFSERLVDVLKIVPSHLKSLTVESPEPLPARYLILGGEALSYEFVSRFTEARSGCRVVNHYGPTETTIGVLTYSLSENVLAPRMGPGVPIGRPLANTRIYILDPHGRPAPVGVVGELYIGGVQVGLGYLNRPELTAERFLPNCFGQEPGGRMYRTGDLGRWLSDGNVEFLGRN